MKDLVDMREDGRTVVGEAPVGSKGSNRLVERAVKEIEGLVRCMYLSL